MTTTRSLICLFALLVACVLPSVWGDASGAVIDEEDEYEDPDVAEPALLVAYKNVKVPKIVQGCNVTISVSLYNVGNGTAAEVSVVDALPADFELIQGTLENVFQNLDPGASVDMEYIAIPRVGDKRFLAQPAKVAYKAAKEQTYRQLLSTTPYMDVLSTRQNVELQLVRVGKYLTLGVLRTRRDWANSIVVLVATTVALAAYATFSSVTRTRADARRRAAERELGVASK